jgi:hypothetical protein
MANILPVRARSQAAFMNQNSTSASPNRPFQDSDRARVFLQSDDPEDDEPGLPFLAAEQFLDGHLPTERTVRRLQTYESEFLMNRRAASQS